MKVVIFGGTGFVGIHYAIYLLNRQSHFKIILVDKKDIEPQFLFPEIKKAINTGDLKVIIADVRSSEQLNKITIDGDISLVANFAAVHREPGHVHAEYFDTNIPGATNVCAFCERIVCETIIFTSSIAVYEPNESVKNELTIPAPISAYGGSKLAAELIHKSWQAKDPENRKLVIVRPGVVYGASEGGNVTRMIKAIKHGYFAFVGNRDTRKASIYVKELILIMEFFLNKDENLIVTNAVVTKPPSMDEYVKAVKKVSGWKRIVPSVPYGFLLISSYFFAGFARMFGKKTGINPVRVRKLRRINNITSTVLKKKDYQYKYSLETAFQDWHDTNKVDW